MALVAGVNIPDGKRLDIALRSIFGIGPMIARKVVRDAGIPPETRVRRLSEDELARVRAAIERGGFPIEGDLRREVQMNIRRLIDIGSYRGLRHRRGLPARGQRTRTNARTKRGARRAVAGRRRTVMKK